MLLEEMMRDERMEGMQEGLKKRHAARPGTN